MNGEYIGSFVCYGYRKDEQDKNKIVPDRKPQGWCRIFAWKLWGLVPIPLRQSLMKRNPPAEYKKAHGEKFKTSFQRNPEASGHPRQFYLF